MTVRIELISSVIFIKQKCRLKFRWNKMLEWRFTVNVFVSCTLPDHSLHNWGIWGQVAQWLSELCVQASYEDFKDGNPLGFIASYKFYKKGWRPFKEWYFSEVALFVIMMVLKPVFFQLICAMLGDMNNVKKSCQSKDACMEMCNIIWYLQVSVWY